MEGNPCTILGDAIGVKIKETIYDKDHYYLSIYPENWVKGVEIRLVMPNNILLRQTYHYLKFMVVMKSVF